MGFRLGALLLFGLPWACGGDRRPSPRRQDGDAACFSGRNAGLPEDCPATLRSRRAGGTHDEVKLGAATVQRIEETYEPNFDAKMFFPDWTARASCSEHRDWLLPNHYDEPSGSLKLSVHSWLLSVGGKRILIDTCVGNHKSRPHRPKWHMMETPYLTRLKAAGVEPDQVDMVMCTHLHVDHVGWNTRLENGKWVPTFKNAKYVFSRTDYDHYLKARQRSQDGAGQRRLVPRFGAAGRRGGHCRNGRGRGPARREPQGRAGARPYARHDRHQVRIAGREGVVLRRHPASCLAGLSSGVEQLRLRRGRSVRARAGARRWSIAPARARA